MNRTPLPENYPLYMENGGEYIIKRKIAEGGFSLVYEAETPGGTAPVVIKEYFPAEGAFRNTQNKVLPLVGYEDSFLRNLNQCKVYFSDSIFLVVWKWIRSNAGREPGYGFYL